MVIMSRKESIEFWKKRPKEYQGSTILIPLIGNYPPTQKRLQDSGAGKASRRKKALKRATEDGDHTELKNEKQPKENPR